jgi:pimeloyl-ACP methyl ester carboxylesterase
MPVAAMAAPYHMARTPVGEFSGEGSVNPNPWLLFAAIRQWTWDQAAANRIIEDRFDLTPSAILGFSLGAFQALLASSAGVLNFPVISVACTNRYAFGVRHGVLSAGLRDGFRRAGIEPDRLDSMVRSLQLERHVIRLNGFPTLHFRGTHDRVDPPPSGERLEKALRPTRSIHLRAGHSSQAFFRKTIARESWKFFSDLGLFSTGRPEPPPPGGHEASERYP